MTQRSAALAPHTNGAIVLPAPVVELESQQLLIGGELDGATALLRALLVTHGPEAALPLAPPAIWQHALRIAGESAIAGGVRRPDLTAIEPPLFDWRHVIAEAQVRLALQHACGAPELVGVAQPLLVSTTDVIAALDCGVSA